jgi:hypothetical protein
MADRQEPPECAVKLSASAGGAGWGMQGRQAELHVVALQGGDLCLKGYNPLGESLVVGPKLVIILAEASEYVLKVFHRLAEVLIPQRVVQPAAWSWLRLPTHQRVNAP